MSGGKRTSSQPAGRGNRPPLEVGIPVVRDGEDREQSHDWVGQQFRRNSGDGGSKLPAYVESVHCWSPFLLLRFGERIHFDKQELELEYLMGTILSEKFAWVAQPEAADRVVPMFLGAASDGSRAIEGSALYD